MLRKLLSSDYNSWKSSDNVSVFTKGRNRRKESVAILSCPWQWFKMIPQETCLFLFCSWRHDPNCRRSAQARFLSIRSLSPGIRWLSGSLAGWHTDSLSLSWARLTCKAGMRLEFPEGPSSSLWDSEGGSCVCRVLRNHDWDWGSFCLPTWSTMTLMVNTRAGGQCAKLDQHSWTVNHRKCCWEGWGVGSFPRRLSYPPICQGLDLNLSSWLD